MNYVVLATETPELFVLTCPDTTQAHNVTISRISFHYKPLKTSLPEVKACICPWETWLNCPFTFKPPFDSPYPFLFLFPGFLVYLWFLSFCTICLLVGCLKCFLKQGDRQAVTHRDTLDLAAHEIWFSQKIKNKSQICLSKCKRKIAVTGAV